MMRFAAITCISLLAVSTALCADASGNNSNAKAATVDFAREVRPILSDICFQCHGPAKKGRKGDLRLDIREEAEHVLEADFKGKIELLTRIRSKDPKEKMPPAKSKLKLTEAQIRTLERWIKQGAPYKQHWAFEPIRKPQAPKVKRGNWARNDIDRFVLARLEARGLSPAAQTNKERLIRRVSFDLTGLPPTLDQIDQFLADQSPKAYESLVDRLLAGSAYGERMASVWLDVARYSDTYGYQVDRDRFVWPWRDWVIKAFNRNMPYDEFVTLQLAGDLLKDATDQQILATTFNRLHPQKVEGGSTPEEFRVEYVADRNHTFGTAFLGMTLECSRCHDHKFDPITQKEYYQLFAFFNSIDEAGLYSYFTKSIPTPSLLLVDDATKARNRKIEEQIRAAQKRLKEVAGKQAGAFKSWLNKRPAEAVVHGRVAHLDFEKFKSGANKSVPGRVGKAVQLSGDDRVGTKVGNFRRYDPFSVALWLNTPDVKDRAVVYHRSRAWTDAASRGYELLLEDGKLSAALIHFWPGNAIRVRTRKPIATKTWQHVMVTYDGSSRAAGLKIFIDGKPAETQVVRDNLYKNITGGGGDNIAIGQRFRDRGFTNGLVDEFSVYNRELTPVEIAHVHDGKTLANLLKAPVNGLSADQRDALQQYYLATVDPEYKKQLEALRKSREKRSKAVDGLSEIMVMRELPEPRPTFLLKRGAYDLPADPVKPGTPSVFPPFPKDQPRNRLGLARWLADPANPLMARVTVNRFWQMCFGHGLVRTPEDFGSQGQTPSHPQLLDYLSADFVANNSDVKRLMKLIVMSATYRQSTVASAASLKGDPENRLLSRAPTYRLSAEMLRDNALAVSGLMVNKIGGAPVRPYEVAVSFKPVRRDKGQGLYRRSIYTYWKRTGPAPVMMALDASKRDVCRVKRERTSSPLQAFVLLNGPQFVEAARMLGQRLIKKHGDDTDRIVTDMFRVLTSRRPSDREKQLLIGLYQDQLKVFQAEPAKAAAYLKTGDAAADKSISASRLAAMGVVANTLMNFDESVMKR